MTTITIERALLEQALNALLLPCDRWNAAQHKIVTAAADALLTALAAPATAPEPPHDAGLMPLIEDYAKAVHDGDDAACIVLKKVIVASLEQSTPATAPEKTVQEIMEFARHYAANTFSSATLEDKIRRSLAATASEKCWCDEQSIGEPGVSCGDCPTRDYKSPATAPEQPSWQDAPTEPGMWACLYMGELSTAIFNAYEIEHFDRDEMVGCRWRFIPEDKQ